MTLHIYEDLEQGTEQWHAARRGIVTASVVGKLISIDSPDALTVGCPTCKAIVGLSCMSMAVKKAPTPIKTIHDSRAASAAERPPVYSVANNDTSRAVTATLAAERITGWTEDSPRTWDMIRGVESEPFARDVYAENFGDVTEVGFMVRQEDDWTLGFSPDGTVGEDGLIEIKSPRAKTHVNTILADKVPAHYLAQCQAGLLVSGREWIDFVSFCGGLPLYHKRVYPDPAWFEVITAAAKQFEQDAARIVADYTARVEGLPMTERIPADLELVF